MFRAIIPWMAQSDAEVGPLSNLTAHGMAIPCDAGGRRGRGLARAAGGHRRDAGERRAAGHHSTRHAGASGAGDAGRSRLPTCWRPPVPDLPALTAPDLLAPDAPTVPPLTPPSPVTAALAAPDAMTLDPPLLLPPAAPTVPPLVAPRRACGSAAVGAGSRHCCALIPPCACHRRADRARRTDARPAGSTGRRPAGSADRPAVGTTRRTGARSADRARLHCAHRPADNPVGSRAVVCAARRPGRPRCTAWRPREPLQAR